MATFPFPVNPELTDISIAYTNPDVALIADEVMPRTPTALSFSWLKYDVTAGLSVPDLKVGRKSYPTEVEFGATKMQDYLTSFALDDFVPNEDIEAARGRYDPRATATRFLTNLLMLGREVRVAGLVFSAANHDNKTTLSGAAQWSDATSDPVAAISDALDVPAFRPNIAIFGQQTWTKLRRNPKLVAAVKGNTNNGSMIKREEFAEFFELAQVYVGAGFVNQGKRRDTLNRTRVWGKHAAFLYRDRAAGPQAGMTWGMTADFGGRMTASIPDEKRGATGGETVRVVERLKELVVAPDLSYYFENAVA